jgi:hypothetical protein
MSGGHCFNASVTPTANTHSNTTVDSVSSMVGVAVGMSVSGSGIPAGTVVAKLTSSSAFVLSAAATTSLTGTTLTIGGDQYYMALIKTGMAGTYGVGSSNYSDITGNSDEVTGTGYTAGGMLLTNVTATTGSGAAWITFSPDPSWTTATFTTAGCMIYNASARLGGPGGGGGRCVAVFDFGGTQTVTGGSFTVVMPVASSSLAIVRLTT